MATSYRDKLLLGGSLVFAIIYLFALPYGLYPAKPFVKAPAVLLLCAYAYLHCEGRERLLLCGALLLSDLGDIFLALEPGFFLHGLISFLVAHLFYIALFLRYREGSLSARHIFISIGFVIYGIGLVYWMYPSLGSMAVPVMVYAAILLGMGISANMGSFGTPMVALGALSFIISDSGIAIDKFHMPVEWFGYVTWSLYVLAQFLIVLGVTTQQRVGSYGS